jgi:hypothetical protein
VFDLRDINMQSERPPTAHLLAVCVALVAAGCSRLVPPTFEATGVVVSEPVNINGLGGPGVWIKHDGLHFTRDGQTYDAVPMRTPFRLPRGTASSALKVGRKVAFKYRERRGLSPDFPFELVEVRSSSNPPETGTR